MIIKTDPSTIQSYLEDSSNLPGGYAEKVFIPETQDDVFSFLKDANKRRCPVTISGGGTGTSGGRIPFGGIVLSTEKLNRIKGLVKKDSGGEIVAESGVLIKDLKARIEKEGLFYTYDPTEQTAFLGGTIATNASGARSFKYGSTRKSVIGLTLALADGSRLEVERGKIKAKGAKLIFDIEGKEYKIPVPKYSVPKTKSSAGYYAEEGMDLIDLFIGQEGTLACILEARLKLNQGPQDIFSCFAFFNNEENACSFAIEARDISILKRDNSTEDINALAIEYFDNNSLDLLRKRYGNVPSGSKACIFFEQEIASSNEDKIADKWLALLSKHGASWDDTWVAMNKTERQGLIDKRHSIGESMNEMARKNNMPKITTDLAVPDKQFLKMMQFYKSVLAVTNIPFFLFGHIGSSHLHMDLFPTTENECKESFKIALKFVKKSVSLGGTVSAEHGIGKMRRKYLKILYGEKGIKEMIKIKKILDPNLILGRGNIFEI